MKQFSKLRWVVALVALLAGVLALSAPAQAGHQHQDKLYQQAFKNWADTSTSIMLEPHYELQADGVGFAFTSIEGWALQSLACGHYQSPSIPCVEVTSIWIENATGTIKWSANGPNIGGSGNPSPTCALNDPCFKVWDFNGGSGYVNVNTNTVYVEWLGHVNSHCSGHIGDPCEHDFDIRMKITRA